jgi:hypothetical protein
MLCARAAAIEPDAAQFLVQSERDGVIEVAWAVEKNHHPVAVGTTQISGGPSGCEDLVSRQARAFAANYSRQKVRG